MLRLHIKNSRDTGARFKHGGSRTVRKERVVDPAALKQTAEKGGVQLRKKATEEGISRLAAHHYRVRPVEKKKEKSGGAAPCNRREKNSNSQQQKERWGAEEGPTQRKKGLATSPGCFKGSSCNEAKKKRSDDDQKAPAYWRKKKSLGNRLQKESP